VRNLLRIFAAVGSALVVALMLAAPAVAATNIDAPSSEPFTVPGDGAGNPQSFTVTVSGFTPGTTVFVEQCDGSDPSPANWSPTAHCDLGTSPAGLTVDPSGNATFPAGDLDFGFQPFKGASPQNIFNCLAPGQASPGNGNPDYTNCKVRVSTSNQLKTSDQVFRTLVLPGGGGGQVPEVPFAVILPLGAVAVGGGYFLVRRRRASAAAA
jgi:hypothetical protein